MARYIAVIKGNRGEASRLGSKDSGIRASINGWNCGVDVVGGVDKDTGDTKSGDRFEVYATSGSNSARARQHVATVRIVSGALEWAPGGEGVYTVVAVVPNSGETVTENVSACSPSAAIDAFWDTRKNGWDDSSELAIVEVFEGCVRSVYPHACWTESPDAEG